VHKLTHTQGISKVLVYYISILMITKYKSAV